MKFSVAKAKIPSLANSLLAAFSAILLTLAFPDFDFWFLALLALVPLFYAVEREKQSIVKSFVLGWIFGVSFFFATCWWLTFAPITYGGVPAVLAYLLFFGVTLVAGFFPAIFAACFSLILKRFGTYAILSAPFLWTATELLRFWITGNNWNAIGYSQFENHLFLRWASFGGVLIVGFLCVFCSACYAVALLKWNKNSWWLAIIPQLIILVCVFTDFSPAANLGNKNEINVIAVQPNVPMSGLQYEDWRKLRQRHVELAENALQKLSGRQAANDEKPTIVVFPESPMNFQFEEDAEFRRFLKDFAWRNDVSVLFNSAQPNAKLGNFFNSAVMVNPQGEKIAQYDKIHLVPFGEFVPVPEPLAQFVPTMVGNFEIGDEYDLLAFGEAKGGVMICFESHFASLAREFVRNGADVLIEMTNDGYLGETPILRQHLANAVFRAVETNRPVLRVTNVGITAFINERGEVLDAATPYMEDTRVWTIGKSDGSQTFYVRYGDWFAWLCSMVSLVLLSICFWKRKIPVDGYRQT